MKPMMFSSICVWFQESTAVLADLNTEMKGCNRGWGGTVASPKTTTSSLKYEVQLYQVLTSSSRILKQSIQSLCIERTGWQNFPMGDKKAPEKPERWDSMPR